MDTIIPGSHRDLLNAKGFAFIATIGPGAAPHVSPTWYLWDAARAAAHKPHDGSAEVPQSAAQTPTSPYASLTRPIRTATWSSAARSTLSTSTRTATSSTH